MHKILSSRSQQKWSQAAFNKPTVYNLKLNHQHKNNGQDQDSANQEEA